MKEQFDIVYSSRHKDRRRIDVFRPEGRANGAAVYFIHGGGFIAGDKEHWREVARHFCRCGYACASVEYRLAPAWQFPAWVEDVRLGMAWFKQRADQFGFDPARVATAGSSAGGYLALILATIAPQDHLGRSDEFPDVDTRPAAVVAYCPLTSLYNVESWLGRDACPDLMPATEADDPDLYRLASIPDRVCGREPPLLFLHGTEDALIPPSVSHELAERVNALGGRAEVVLIDGAEHGFGYGVTTGFQKAAIAHAERFGADVL